MLGAIAIGSPATSIGSVYQFFPAKEAIFTAVAERCLARTRTLVEGMLSSWPAERHWAELVDLAVDGVWAQHREDLDLRALLRNVHLYEGEEWIGIKDAVGDLTKKFELGRRLFASGDMDGTIGMMQEAQNDPKNRIASLTFLGQAFLKMDYVDEAIETFRRALESREIGPETTLELRYHLCTALQARAESARESSPTFGSKPEVTSHPKTPGYSAA